MGADIARVVHIAPRANAELHAVTSPALANLGGDVFDVWRGVLARPDRFVPVVTGAAFSVGWTARHPGIAQWWSYVSRRYASALAST